MNSHETSRVEYSSREIREIIQDVIDDKYEIFDARTMADYDADFSGEEPYFIEIRAKTPGYGFGYIVFHDFLRRVGKENTFNVTDLNEASGKMFEKAQKAGLVEHEENVVTPENVRYSRWKVIGDPVENLEKIRDSWE